MNTNASKYVNAYWEEAPLRTIIRLTMTQDWRLEHVYKASEQVEALIANLPFTVGVIVCVENSHWLPPDFNEIVALLTNELHPNIIHIVFVSEGPLFEAAFEIAMQLNDKSVSHVSHAKTVKEARHRLRLIPVGRSLYDLVYSGL